MWAHIAELAVANSVTEENLSTELRRLGASYGVSIVSYGLSSQLLESLPSATEILKMPRAEFEEQVADKVVLTRLSTVKERTSLDWEHIKDLRHQSTDFEHLFEWVAHCLSEKCAYPFTEFLQLQKINRKYAPGFHSRRAPL